MPVIVFPGTKVRSVDTTVDGKIARQDGQPYSVFELLDLREALSTAFSSDAHFALYSLPGLDTYKQARLSKRILPHLKQMDLEPCVTVLALDVDNPGHARHESFTSAGLGLENVYSAVANELDKSLRALIAHNGRSSGEPPPDERDYSDGNPTFTPTFT